jgi:uncharacterized protein (DUF1501 family)
VSELRGAVVVVFLRGGADGLSLVPPIGDDDYHRSRPQLAVAPKDALRLDGLFGLHPALGDLLPLFREGQLAVVPACGSDDDTRSHFEAQDRMEQGGPAVAGGWLGRWLREQTGQPDRDRSPGGLAAVGLGTALPESLRGAPGAVVLRSLDELSLGGDGAPGAVLRDQLLALYAGDPLLSGPARDTLAAVARLERMRSTAYHPPLGASYDDDAFAASLQQVARLLRADVGVRAACLDLPGWDSHVFQDAALSPRMRQLARGLAAFARDLGPLLQRTSVVVMTEFGRRVRENSALGTDHGRGSVLLVLGGGTPGGVHGRWPGLSPDVLEGPGDVPAANDYRDVLASVLLRHGRPSAAAFPGHPTAAIGV